MSGTKRIDEREGMSTLFELIADRKIAAVACQDEDRLFRDMTQIQVNIFIDTCRKSNVKVITPYFTYDFGHPLHGEFHARQFRFKCDMAAEYIKSYVLGRLAPARQRLLREGKWAGAKMPVGYMVDMRKHLADGTENPNWRKFVSFEPYAEIVRQYYRLFLENGCAIRKTLRHIRNTGLSFPDCKPPDGFKVSYQIKHRGDGYFLTRGNFVNLLINPVYIGHWCYRGVVQCWNNHEPLVDSDTFMRAFNALSRYTLTGEDNPDFEPAYQYVRPEADQERPVERPLLSGLIYTKLAGKWCRAGTVFEKRTQCYLYLMDTIEIEGTTREWARRSVWVDEAVVLRFRQKLNQTFQAEVFAEALENTQQLIERERKLKLLQHGSIAEDMQNLIRSLESLTNPDFIREVEQRYIQREQEKKRLETELAALEHKRQRKVSLEHIYALFQQAANNWDEMTQDERRNVLLLFVQRIEAYDYNRSGEMKLLVRWKDGNSDEIELWHKPHSAHWTQENVHRLLALFDSDATQLDIAAAFPTLKWYQIYNEIKKHRGLVRFTPCWLGKAETYQEYVASGGRKGKSSGSFWRDEELVTLRRMVEQQRTQLEIMQKFPYRRWIRIQERIKDMFGVGTRVPYSGISQRLSYVEYMQDDTSSEDEGQSKSAQQSKNDNSECSSGIVAPHFLWMLEHVLGFHAQHYRASQQY